MWPERSWTPLLVSLGAPVFTRLLLAEMTNVKTAYVSERIKVMFCDMAWLREALLNPEEILAITFAY